MDSSVNIENDCSAGTFRDVEGVICGRGGVSTGLLAMIDWGVETLEAGKTRSGRFNGLGTGFRGCEIIST
jgi:hypothetical protein